MSKLTITVTDKKSNALAGVAIGYSLDSTTGSATTDATGVASFADLAAGTYAISAVLEGYNDGSASISIDGTNDVEASLVLSAKTLSDYMEDIWEEVSEFFTEQATAGSTTLSEILTTDADTWVNNQIAWLKSEISTTSNKWVKLRNLIELFGAEVIYPIVKLILKGLYTAQVATWITKTAAWIKKI
jgi:hypothetical protein